MASSDVLIVIRAVDRASAVLKGVKGSVNDLGAGLKTLSMDALAAVALLTATAIIAKKAFDFGYEGAQIERLRETGTRLAESWGVDMTSAIEKIKAASLDTISANRAVLDVNRLLLLGITRDTDQMAKLVEIATLRGRAMGLSAQDAFDRITLGIGRLSTRILDDIGIVVDGETAYTNYARSIGKTADQLTEAEKRVALTNAIIDEGNRLLEASGGLAVDNATAFERLSTTWEDTANVMKQMMVPATTALANALDDMLIRLRGGAMVVLSGYIQTLLNVDQSQKGLKRTLEDTSGATGGLVTDFDAMAKAAEKLSNITGTVANVNLNSLISTALDFQAAAGMSAEQIDRLRLEFGLLDPAVMAFRNAMRSAMLDGIISTNELTIAVLRLRAALAAAEVKELQKKFHGGGGGGIDRDAELRRRLLDIQIGFNRKLQDIDIRAIRSREDAAAEHRRNLVGIERDYQKDLANAEERFSRSRLRAIIDRDARALFEAEVARQDDIDDAKGKRQDGIRDETEDYARRRDQIDLERKRDREDAEKWRKQEIEDAERHANDMTSSAAGGLDAIEAIKEANEKLTKARLAAAHRSTLASDREFWDKRKLMAQQYLDEVRRIMDEANAVICFPAGTLITMGNGSLKVIEDICRGDTVLSWDISLDIPIPAIVNQIFSHPEIIDSSRSIVIVNNEFSATPNHPVFSNGNWVEVGALKIGDTISRWLDGATNLTASIVESIYELPYSKPVYNLQVSHINHNYFANGVLVHNKNAGGILPPAGKPQPPGDNGDGDGGGGGGGFVKAPGRSGAPVRVVLDVRGDGMLANAIRQSATQAFVDIVERA